jgi:hypothetical protein
MSMFGYLLSSEAPDQSSSASRISRSPR